MQSNVSKLYIIISYILLNIFLNAEMGKLSMAKHNKLIF